MSRSTIQFVIGNTYNRIPASKAEKNRNGTNPKIHDWVLFLDVVEGDPSTIHYVKFDLSSSFRPSSFECYCPVKTMLAPPSSFSTSSSSESNGTVVQRFKTRQQSTKGLVATITIVGSGGSKMKKSHVLVLDGNGIRRPSENVEPYKFTESKSIQPAQLLHMAPIPKDMLFGIGIELSCSENTNRETVARAIQIATGFKVCNIKDVVNDPYPVDAWKCLDCLLEPQDPCYFELMSPLARGDDGINTCKTVIHTLHYRKQQEGGGARANNNNNANISQSASPLPIILSSDMGFHIHIEASKFSLDQLKKICQNFVKYEEAMDALFPSNRRTKGCEYNRYFYSNKLAVRANTNAERHKLISECYSISELVDLTNPTGQCYKLNLQNLKSISATPIIEFRQHNATTDEKYLHAWITFCMLFVHNSARFKPPSFLKESRNIDDQFDFLFQYVIKDRMLEQFYRKVRKEMVQGGEEM